MAGVGSASRVRRGGVVMRGGFWDGDGRERRG